MYDKLVVLQLLRPRFTDEFFFTTDLDARLFHPAELKWTRNVLVASSFGLQLEHDLQKDIPPFRDTYQAGEYLACLAALDYRNTRTNLNFITPRLFEIGRRGPYDLSISTSPIHPRPPWQRRKAFLDDFPFGAVLLVSVGGVILALYVLAWKTHTRSSKCSTEVLSVNDIDLRELALKLDEPATPEAASGRRLCAELSQRSIEFLNRFGTSHPQRKPHPGDLPEDLPDDLPRRTEFVRDLNKILRTSEPDSAETGDPERKSEPDGATPANTARYQRNRHALEKMCPLGIAQQPHHPRWTIRACLIWLLVLALIGLVLFLDHFTPGGQPFAWNEGLSVGPTELIRALAAGLACIWFFRSRSELLERKEKFVHDFGLPAITTGKMVKELRERKAARELRERSEGRRLPASRLGRAAAWLQRRFPATWRVLSYLFWIRIGKWEPVRAPSADDKEPMVDGVELFKQYNFLGYWRHRVYRLVFPVAVYLLFSFALLLLSEQPFRPYRGAVILWLDHSLIVLTVFWQTVLIFFVVDAVHLCHQLIDNLIEGPVHWPAATWRIFEAKLGVPREYLGEYITIQVIANRTDAVGRLIFYPFVVLFLTIVSRSSYFDRFDWPIGIVLIYGLASLLAVCAVWQLRAAAEKARKVALAGLNEKLLRALAGKQPAGGPQDLAAKRGQEVKGEKLKVADQKESDKSDPVEQIRVLLDEIRSCEKGAFAPITQQPVIKGLLLPASGAGLASLLEYLSALQ